jgi:hypothetical protein
VEYELESRCRITRVWLSTRLQKEKEPHRTFVPSATNSSTKRMSRVISALIETHPELADVFTYVLYPYLLPNAAVAKARYDSVVSELRAIIVEHHEQQDEMMDWNDRWPAEVGDAGADDDDDDGVWAAVHEEDTDISEVDELCPSWILLCYGSGVLQVVG